MKKQPSPRSWWRCLLKLCGGASLNHRHRNHRSSRVSLNVESLESRLVPARFDFLGGGTDPSLWEDPANWGQTCPPGSGDDVYFTDVQSLAVVNATSSVAVLSLNFDAPSMTLNFQTSFQAQAFNLSNGTVNLQGPATVTNLRMAGGTLGGAGTLSVSGELDWWAGTMAGTGTTEIGPEANLFLEAGSPKTLGRTTVNYGDATWYGDDTITGGTFRNAAQGLFVIWGDGTLAGVSFINEGTLRKDGEGGTTLIESGSFVNSALVEIGSGFLEFPQTSVVNTGQIRVYDGGLSISSGWSQVGTIYLGQNGSVEFLSSMALSVGTSVTGSGTALFSAGTVYWLGGTYDVGETVIRGGNVIFDISAATDHLYLGPGPLDGSTLDGSGQFTVRRSFLWAGGDLLGTGILQIDAAAEMMIAAVSEVNTKHFGARTLENLGTIVWSGEGNIEFTQPAATINNRGTFEIVNNQSMRAALNAQVILNNYGTLRKQRSWGTTRLENLQLRNYGTVNIDTGTVRLQGSSMPPTEPDRTIGLNEGTVTLADERSTLVFANGFFDWNAGAVSGPGKFGVDPIGMIKLNATLPCRPWSFAARSISTARSPVTGI